MRFPPGSIELHNAAKEFGFTWSALRRAITRKRLKGFKVGSAWFTTRAEVSRYRDDRNVDKIPKRYRDNA